MHFSINMHGLLEAAVTVRRNVTAYPIPHNPSNFNDLIFSNVMAVTRKLMADAKGDEKGAYYRLLLNYFIEIGSSEKLVNYFTDFIEYHEAAMLRMILTDEFSEYLALGNYVRPTVEELKSAIEAGIPAVTETVEAAEAPTGEATAEPVSEKAALDSDQFRYYVPLEDESEMRHDFSCRLNFYLTGALLRDLAERVKNPKNIGRITPYVIDTPRPFPQTIALSEKEVRWVLDEAKRPRAAFQLKSGQFVMVYADEKAIVALYALMAKQLLGTFDWLSSSNMSRLSEVFPLVNNCIIPLRSALFKEILETLSDILATLPKVENSEDQINTMKEEESVPDFVKESVVFVPLAGPDKTHHPFTIGMAFEYVSGADLRSISSTYSYNPAAAKTISGYSRKQIARLLADAKRPRCSFHFGAELVLVYIDEESLSALKEIIAFKEPSSHNPSPSSLLKKLKKIFPVITEGLRHVSVGHKVRELYSAMQQLHQSVKHNPVRFVFAEKAPSK